MKPMHYKVILKYTEYREPYTDSGIQDSITYETLEEILQKFPSFEKTLTPEQSNIILVGDKYHGIYLSHIQLTYDNIDNKRPTEKELQNYYVKHNGKSFKSYF